MPAVAYANALGPRTQGETRPRIPNKAAEVLLDLRLKFLMIKRARVSSRRGYIDGVRRGRPDGLSQVRVRPRIFLVTDLQVEKHTRHHVLIIAPIVLGVLDEFLEMDCGSWHDALTLLGCSILALRILHWRNLGRRL